MRSIFVIGTDTGVGKTLVTAGLAAALRRRGVDVGVMKPFATGCRRLGGRLVSDDSLRLIRAAGVLDSLDLVTPVALAAPMAPAMAARLSRRVIRLDPVWDAFRELRRRHKVLIVEGIGGLLVPVAGSVTVADIAWRMKLPAIIVTRSSLGTLNHSALTVGTARRAGIPVLGLVVNDGGGRPPGSIARHNAVELPGVCRVPVLAHLHRRPAPAVFERILDQL
jgi:dethiobiotin synthetase